MSPPALAYTISFIMDVTVGGSPSTTVAEVPSAPFAAPLSTGQLEQVRLLEATRAVRVDSTRGSAVPVDNLAVRPTTMVGEATDNWNFEVAGTYIAEATDRARGR